MLLKKLFLISSLLLLSNCASKQSYIGASSTAVVAGSANFMPGLRKGYFYRSCVLNLGMNYEDMIFNITNTGLSSKEFSKINIRKI
jgi:hypothetical protein